jgi:hypothetical protein
MQWRRGLLLAGIHLAVAVLLIVALEARGEEILRDHLVNYDWQVDAPSQPSKQDGETVIFNPCSVGWAHYPPQTTIVGLANFPAYVLTEWRLECPSSWSLSGQLTVKGRHATLGEQRQIDLGLIFLIAVQWFLIGAFPLTKFRHSWAEPGIIITIGAVASGLLALIPNPQYDSLPAAPMLLAWFAWLCWFGLLLWKTARAGWRLIRRKMAHTS